MISVVFPAYNEEANVAELHRRLVAALTAFNEPFEIVAVNNASKDHTREELLKLKPLKLVSLAYNIGQTAGLDAGIRNATGDIVVTIDADLQNDPADIPMMVRKLREGYDVVVGWRKDRHDNAARKVFSRFANWVTRRIAGLSIHDYGCALRVFKRADIEDIRLYGVMHVFMPVILASRGARIAEVVTTHHERRAGTTKYTFSNMATNIADLLTIKFLYNYAKRPLVFFGGWALASAMLAVISFGVATYIKFSGGYGYSQTPLPVFSALLVIVGFLLFIIGFLTELLIRIYYETRGQTPYKITEVIELE